MIFIAKNSALPKLQGLLLLLLIINENNNITTKLYDKRDAFGFHIVNFPSVSRNVPSTPAYVVYAFQLIRYARCSNYISEVMKSHPKGDDHIEFLMD